MVIIDSIEKFSSIYEELFNVSKNYYTKHGISLQESEDYASEVMMYFLNRGQKECGGFGVEINGTILDKIGFINIVRVKSKQILIDKIRSTKNYTNKNMVSIDKSFDESNYEVGGKETTDKYFNEESYYKQDLRKEYIDETLDELKLTFNKVDLENFRLFTFEGYRDKDIAEKLNMTYNATMRVKRTKVREKFIEIYQRINNENEMILV